MVVERRSRLALAAAIGVSLAWSASGEASPAAFEVDLVYDVAPGCPDTSDFKAAVVARLGHDPFTDGAPERVVVRMAPRGGSIGGVIEWRDTTGNWAGEQAFPLVTNDCLRLARAMAFALAVQIQLLASTRAAAEPGVSGRAPAAAEAAPPPPPAVAVPAQVAPPPPVATEGPPPPPVRGPRPALAVGAGPSVGFGLSSGPILLGRIFGSLAWPRFAIELGGVLSLPATTRRADGAGFTQQEVFASAAACAAAGRLRACLLANAGGVRMVGKDIDQPKEAWVPLVEAGARLGVRQDLGPRLYVTAYADGLTLLTRWTASLDRVPVWTAPRFAATLGLDLGVRFP